MVISANQKMYNKTDFNKIDDENLTAEILDLLSIIDQGIVENTEENIALKKEILSLFSIVNIDSNSFSNDIKEDLRRVVSILNYEELIDMNDIALEICMENKKIKQYQEQRSNTKFSCEYDIVFSKSKSTIKKSNELQEVVKSLEKMIEDFQECQESSDANEILLKKKLMDYESTVENLEKELDEKQLEKYDTDGILNEYHQYLNLKGELAELNENLGRYRDLPPNLLQAKGLFETKQQEYQRVQDAIQREMLNFHAN